MTDKSLASQGVADIIPSAPRLRVKLRAGQTKCGCSSVVEHLLAKEDVASSSLVTRSPPPFFPVRTGAPMREDDLRFPDGSLDETKGYNCVTYHR